ncbi:MAG TPA: tRNA pseudouridine(55) synthase TruB [Ktedonobacteraceae bacterium]|nr:tRNA pseudouridine(55) synthase TruB [Ktedonobacteraceae bacterium]
MDGILNIHKPTGMTSHDVVAKVRKVLQQRRVGHAGTLDPAASGVLPICIGQGTRVAEYLSESGKEYRATIIFGIETDTYDTEGEITRVASTETLNRARIEKVLAAFLGPQMQTPPRYSAIKIQGQAAYKRARAGEELALAARPVEFFSLEIVDWQAPILTLDVACSKGTYIRSLAYDLGRAVACGAHLGKLIRTRSGPFRLEQSITLEELATADAQGEVARYVQSADMALQQYPALHLDETTEQRVRHGNAFSYDISDTERSLARVYNTREDFIAIAGWEPQLQRWQPIKVFPSGESAST